VSGLIPLRVEGPGDESGSALFGLRKGLLGLTDLRAPLSRKLLTGEFGVSPDA
jgi:hypothetical protein